MNISTADDDVRYVPEEAAAKDFCSMAHESRYLWLAQQFDLSGKKVLDFGCGSGYGAAFLATRGAEALGIDISQAAIEYARKTYASARFLSYDLTDTALPRVFDPERFDIIVSFDVIEHVEKYWSFVENIKLLLKEDGVAVIGCPNRAALFEVNFEWNPHHMQEFTPLQLERLLSSSFSSVAMYGQDFTDEESRARLVNQIRRGKPMWHLKSFIKTGPMSNYLRKLKTVIDSVKTHGVALSLAQEENRIAFRPILPGDPSNDKNPPFGLVAVCR